MSQLLRRLKRLPFYLRWLLLRASGRQADRPPVFVMGAGHSGTSVLLAILGRHPSIHAIPGESGILLDEDRALFDRALAAFARETVVRGKRRWAEKTPQHVLHISRLFDWKPDSRVIVIVRDGRDVAASIKARSGSARQGMERWMRDVEASRPWWEDPRVTVVRYEALVTEFAETTRSLLDWLAEDWVDLSDFHVQRRTWYAEQVEKPSSAFGDNHDQHRNWQINQPLFDGRGKWRELTTEELEEVTSLGADLLYELEYLDP